MKGLQAGGCLLCAAAAVNSFEDISGTEAVGGIVTGPMITAAAVGALLFFAAILMTLLAPLIARLSVTVAFFLCLPLYIYRTLPAFFRVLFPGEYKGGVEGNFVWHRWSITGVLASIFVVYLCYKRGEGAGKRTASDHPLFPAK